MLAKQLTLLKEASQMTSDLDQEGQGGVYRVESWRKDIPGRIWHVQRPGGERLVRKEHRVCGEGNRGGTLQAKLGVLL